MPEFGEEPEELHEQSVRRSADLEAAASVEEEVVGTLCLALESGVSRRPHWRLNRRSQGVDVPRQTAAVWGALKEARRGWGGVRGSHDGEGLGVRGGCLKRLHTICFLSSSRRQLKKKARVAGGRSGGGRSLDRRSIRGLEGSAAKGRRAGGRRDKGGDAKQRLKGEPKRSERDSQGRDTALA